MTRYIGALLVVAAAIGAAAHRTYRNERTALDLAVRQRLEQMSRLKAGQLAAWRRERMGDAATAQAAAQITPSLMQSLRVNYQYASVVLLDGQGRERLTNGEHLLTAADYGRLAAEAAAGIVFREVRGRLDRPLVALAAARTGADETLVLIVDPAVSIAPTILQWPLASPTSRVVLVATGDTPPASGPGVLTASAPVPSSSWSVVAAVDRDDAFRPLVEALRQIVTSAALLILLCAISLGLIWRHQRAQFYRQQYEAEAERQALRGHYDYLTRYANDALVLTDDSGQLIEVNDRASEMYGYTREDLLEMNIRELRSPASRPLFDQHWALAHECGSLVYEVDQRRKDGSVFPVEASTRVVRAGGQVLRQTSVRDITKRRRAEASAIEQDRQRQIAEEELRVSRDRLERVLDAAEEAYWDRNIATGDLMTSPRWYTMLGYVPGEIRFTWESFIEMVHPDDRPSSAQLATKIAVEDDASGGHQREFRLRCKSGQYIWVRSRGRTIERDGVGRPVRRIGTLSDITESKKLEAQVLQSQKLESIGRLAGGVAHDFNSLLTVINGYVDLVLAQIGDDAPHVAHLQAIKQAGHRAAALTHQLLTFSRQQQIQPRVLSLNATVREIEGLLRRMAGDRVELAIHLDATGDRVVADLTQMHQVLMNLVANARDAMPEGGLITIQTATRADHIRLSVGDTGTGMNDEIRSQIFEPFFTTKAPGKGTGLGLATVYGIVRRSGGSIHVDSEPGRGTVFEIDFPAAGAATRPAVATAPEAALPADVVREPAAPRATVLIVDDDEHIRELLAEALDDRFDVLTAAGGADAIDIVRRGAIDIVLTDLFMPGIEGLEVVRQVRAIRPDLRIIAMSGAFGGAFLAGAARAGVDATLRKPVDLPALQQTLEGLRAA